MMKPSPRLIASKQSVQVLHRALLQNLTLAVFLLLAALLLIKFGSFSSHHDHTHTLSSSSHPAYLLRRHLAYSSASTRAVHVKDGALAHTASQHDKSSISAGKEAGEEEDEEDLDRQNLVQLEPTISDWDRQRQAKLLAHNHSTINSILLVSGSRPKACDSPHGDHFLLKFMKNKVDYCRLHGMQMFYNMAQMDNALTDFWSKLPLLRNLMLSHPEVEWLWWMDSDAMITDMAFELPMEKYRDYNLVLHGWGHEVYDKKSWIGLNTGIFLLRNCQWSIDLIDSWSLMGAKGKVRDAAGVFLSQALSDRPPLFEADDQSSLVYLLVTQKERWESQVYLEYSYCLHGYWDLLVDKYEEMMETSHPGYGDDRWPFVTHFVGCKPCGAKKSYAEERCLSQMERAFNFADNQVLQQYGFKHKDLGSFKVKRMRQQIDQVLTVETGK